MSRSSMFSFRSLALAGAAAAMGFTAAAGAATITLQEGANGYNGTTDVLMAKSNPTHNYGTFKGLHTRRAKTQGNNTSYEDTSVIRFDLGSATPPAGQVLQSATLTLTEYYAEYGDAASGTNPDTNVAIHRLLRGFDEGLATWDKSNVPSGAAWDAGGAQGDGVDRVAGATDTTTVDASSSGYGAYDWDVTSDVQAFLNNTATNYGWELDETGAVSPNYLGFGPYYLASDADSGDGATIADRPKLTLTFVPEPASLALLGVGGGLLLAGRRRRAS